MGNANGDPLSERKLRCQNLFEIIDTKSARHRVDHGTICGRSCANSEHYKPLCACVDRTFVNSPFSKGAAWFTATPQPDLSSAADADHPNATRKLRQPLLQLLTVVVGGSPISALIWPIRA